jgi:hypothetical protein
MVLPRGALPLILTGSSGLALLAFGVGGLQGMDPTIERAAQTVQLERTTPDRLHQLATCPPASHRDDPDEV